MISSNFQKDSTTEFATIFLGFHLKFYVFGALQMSILAARFWQRSPGRAGGQWAPAVGRPTMHQVVLVHGFFSMICINCSCSHLFTSFHIFSRVNWASNFPNEIFSQRHRRHDRRFPVTQVFTVGALEFFSLCFLIVFPFFPWFSQGGFPMVFPVVAMVFRQRFDGASRAWASAGGIESWQWWPTSNTNMLKQWGYYGYI